MAAYSRQRGLDSMATLISVADLRFHQYFGICTSSIQKYPLSSKQQQIFNRPITNTNVTKKTGSHFCVLWAYMQYRG
jgi:hypothetical protein